MHRNTSRHFGWVSITNKNHQWWHYLLETARPQTQQDSAGGTRDNSGRNLRCISLKVAKICEDVRPTSVAQQAIPASQTQPPSLSTEFQLYSLQTCTLHRSCLIKCHASADITLPISPSPRNHQETTAYYHISQWSPNNCSSIMQCEAV